MQQVTASWYGKEFDGKTTASGSVYDSTKLLCAHRTLPFGALVTLLNPSNKHVIDVVVVDRGPFVAGRDFDLSEAAALALGFRDKGVTKLLLVSRTNGIEKVKTSFLNQPTPVLTKDSNLSHTASDSTPPASTPLDVVRDLNYGEPF